MTGGLEGGQKSEVQCNLDYPDLLKTHKYITTHAQKAWLMIL